MDADKLRNLIFYVETETRELSACPIEDVEGECEALDVEAAHFLFWNSRGVPLVPKFMVPNKRGLFTVANGRYRLVETTEIHHADLHEALEHILYVNIEPPLNSIESIRAWIDKQCQKGSS